MQRAMDVKPDENTHDLFSELPYRAPDYVAFFLIKNLFVH